MIFYTGFLIYRVLFFTGMMKSSEVVAFYVKRTTTLSGSLPLNVHFNVIQTNFGGFWNSVTSSFVAPVKGIYVFHLSFMGYLTNKWCVTQILHNEVVVQQAMSHGSYYATATASVVIELAVLDQVHVRLSAGVLYETGYSYAHFTGYLLSEIQ